MSQNVGSTQMIPQNADLEGLAVELKIQIIGSLPSMASLSAIVHASPSIHQAYQSKGRDILEAVLFRDLDLELQVDAVILMKALNYQRDTSNLMAIDDVKKVIQEYQFQRRKPPASYAPFAIDELLSLAKIQKTVRHVVDIFCATTLSSHPTSGECVDPGDELSFTESRRIYRAFYRFELFCILFSDSEFGHSTTESFPISTWSRILSPEDRSYLFLKLFPSWEVEEIACVHDFLMCRYIKSYENRWEEVSEASEDHLEQDWDHKTPYVLFFEILTYAETCMSHGMRFFQRFWTTSDDERLQMLKETRLHMRFLSTALEENGYDFDRRTSLFDTWIHGQEEKFVSDKKGPNAAWTWSNNEMMHIHYFQEEKKELRAWHYVMWDRNRLDGWKITPEQLAPNPYQDILRYSGKME